MIYDSEIFSPLQSSISPRNQVQIRWFLIPWNRFEVIFHNLHFPQFLSSIHRPIWSILKNTSRISLFPCGFDPYLPLYPSIRYIFIKLVSSELFLTRDRVKSTTSRSRLVKPLIELRILKIDFYFGSLKIRLNCVNFKKLREKSELTKSKLTNLIKNLP